MGGKYVVSSIIRVCLIPRPLISLSTFLRILCLMVGGGTNLSCAFLYRRMNSQEDLAIGSTSKKEGDCFMFGVVFFISISGMNPRAADVSSLKMDSWKRRLRARQCRSSAGRMYSMVILCLVASRSADRVFSLSVLIVLTVRNFILGLESY